MNFSTRSPFFYLLFPTCDNSNYYIPSFLKYDTFSSLERQKEALEEEKQEAMEEAKEKEKAYETKLSEERAAISLKGVCGVVWCGVVWCGVVCVCVCVCVCIFVCVCVCVCVIV